MYTYATFTQALSTFTSVPLTNAAFAEGMPTIIDQAEQKIYTALNLLSAVIRDSSGVTSAISRDFTLPQPGGSLFVVVQSINIINSAVRFPVIKAARELVDFLFPADAGNGTLPTYWAPVTDQQIIFGPAAITNYQVEVIGTIRPATLSETNTTTWLSTQMPALLFAAGMVSAAGYLQNYGQMADDPKLSVTWQSQYDQLLPTYQNEETMRKFKSYYGGA